MRARAWRWIGVALLALVTACASSGSGDRGSTTTSLEPPDAAGPAAGSCSIATGSVGVVLIGPDLVPSPRCVVIRHDQSLRVTNESGQRLKPHLGRRMNADVADGSSVTFPGPVGRYFAPGVHRLRFTSASAADVWVDAVCPGGDGAACTTPT